MKYNFRDCFIFGEKNYFPQNLERKNYILYYNYEIIIYSHVSHGSATSFTKTGLQELNIMNYLRISLRVSLKIYPFQFK